ncbi:hypothetical protein CHS0354_029055 [Potamilus streckersoni]|uniref:Deoxyribonuclease n=1 Tax=Potamilus streckersoni TaxID=2493646 RepID=A0AAE0SS73_9BIVA|nr:hypothetical protein CHS0354_029055 [Potamilus streckersoni]
MNITKSPLIFITLLVLIQFFGEVHGNIKIGAFNMKVFGVTKASKPKIMDILIKIILRYDVILLQEIRDSTDAAIGLLLQEVNRRAGKRPFMMKISERLGRTNSKEQYAFFYRTTSGISLRSSYVYNDNANDIFEREPFVVHFDSTKTNLMRFALVGIHVKPKDAVNEITALSDVIKEVTSRLKETNIIIMGDLNADCSYVSKSAWTKIPLRQDTKVTWPVGDNIDTTTGTTDCAYDRFIVSGAKIQKNVVKGSVRVFYFDTEYSLSYAEALEVSDHYPIELELI